MIQIINLRGQTLKLLPGTAISIERNNPLFLDSDNFFEDITYSFPTGLTDSNKEFYNSAHLVETDNQKYEQPVQVITSGIPFFAGVLSYSFESGQFQNLLKINLGTLADRAKNTLVASIYTNDNLPTSYSAADMKTVCQNPANYPYSFFPVSNEGWNGADPISSGLINAWDHNNQQFLEHGFSIVTTSTPFFKLNYILKKIVAFLGFKCEGSWLDNPENDKIYIYTMIMSAHGGFFGEGDILDATAYMPSQLTITDFFKIIRERFFIKITFDVFTGIASVLSGTDMLSNTTLVDISANITAFTEIETPEQNGFSITLKPDSNNLLFKDPVNVETTVFIPTNILLIGNQEKQLELKSSTLKTRTYDSLGGDVIFPATMQQVYSKANDQVPQFQICFLKYNGMVTVAGGKIYPQATPMELTLADAKWYTFLNDSKKIKLNGLFTPVELLKLDASTKIGITSKEGFYTTALIEKISYNLPNDDSTYITAEITCRTIVNTANTQASVVAYTSYVQGTTVQSKIKAFYLNTGLTGINLEMYYKPYYTEYINANYSDYIKPPVLYTQTLTTSTDVYGVGNAIVFPSFDPKLYYRIFNFAHFDYDYPTLIEQELRVKTGTPKYAIINNKKQYFTARDGYWYIEVYAVLKEGLFDNRGIWIIF